MDQECVSQIGAAVAEHRIHAFFPISMFDVSTSFAEEATLEQWADSAKNLTLATLAGRLGWATESAGSPDESIWREIREGKPLLISDFYPHVRQILGEHANDPGLCRSFSLGTKLLERGPGDNNRPVKRRLRMALGNAAFSRCGLRSIDICVDGARLFAFRSGLAIVNIFWHIDSDGDLSADGLLEANYFIAHGDHRLIHLLDGNLQPADCSLHEIVESLLPKVSSKQPWVHLDRRILYSVVRLDREVDAAAMEALAASLSHLQTRDYRLSPKSGIGEVWQPFVYVCHAIASEGGASVIYDQGQASGFVQAFVKGTHHNTYIPLFLSCLHNHFWLLNQTEWIPARRRAGGHAEVDALEHLYEATIEFRRYYHFPLVSQISLHNVFYQKWQRTLQIDERLNFVEKTARDVTELVKSRRIRFVERLSGAVGGFLLTHELLEFISSSGLPGSVADWRVWLVQAAHASPEDLELLVHTIEHWEIGIFAGSLIGAAIGLWLSWNFGARLKQE